MKIQKIVVVGGGFAGCKTALELANKKGFQVTLIAPTNNFEYHGALYRSATGRSPLEVVIPFGEMFKRAKNVQVQLDAIERLDPNRKIVISQTGNRYAYDTLILALGNTINYFGIEGMESHSFALGTVPHAIAVRNKLTELFKQPDSTPCIAIVGGGASGVELAAEVRTFAKMVAQKYGGKTVHPHVVLIEGTDRILPHLDPVLSAKAYKRLQKRGVEVRVSTTVNSCEPGKVCLDSGDINCDVIVWTAGSRAVDFYSEHPKVFTMEKGRVKVDEYLRAAGHDDIYVLGDNALTPFSGMAQTALYDAKFVARNLQRVQRGKRPVQYRARHPIYVIPVGERWAVVQTQKRMRSGYSAWLVRRQADKWIFRNFLPYKAAIKQWRRGNRKAQF